MIGAKSGLSALRRDERGNVLPLAAVGLVVSAALVGGGIDMSRAYRVENRLQSACDAAALAGRRAVGSNGFDGTALAQANSYFNTNFDDATQETTTTSKTFSSADSGQTVTGTASTTLKLAVMKIFGFPSFKLAVTCQASMGVGNSDVMMVLDTTGSMTTALDGSTRIAALRSAMKGFYTTVKTATNGTNARIRYGFVPFSSSVNVGKLLYAKDPTYLRSTRDIQSRQPEHDGSATTENGNPVNAASVNDTSVAYANQTDCNTGSVDTTWADSGSSYTLPIEITRDDDYGRQSWEITQRQPQARKDYYQCYQSGSNWYRRYYPQTRNRDTIQPWIMRYKVVSYDLTAYKTFAAVSTSTGDFGASQTSSAWAGCIEERGSTNASSFSYSTTLGMTPAAAKDLDIDSAPSDDNTRWSPMWKEVAYIRRESDGDLNSSATSTRGSRVGSYCPSEAQLLTTMTQSEFDDYADDLDPQGSTYLDIGMTWGGRLSSPTGIFQDNVNIAPSNGGEVSRHIIFMSDGQMEPNYTIQSAWGIEYHDQRVTSNGYSNDASRHTSRFLALCAAIKAKGIRIWTIAFTTGASSDLTTCASPDSDFNADDAEELDEAFQEIAKQVGELRIIQ